MAIPLITSPLSSEHRLLNSLGLILNLTKPLTNRPQAGFAVTLNGFDVVRDLKREPSRHRVKVEPVDANDRAAVVTGESVLIAPRIEE